MGKERQIQKRRAQIKREKKKSTGYSEEDEHYQ
jgi:hypothetical protein